MFSLITEGIDYLVDKQRHVGMGAHPEFVHWINSSLTCGAQCKFHFQRISTTVCDPVNFILKAFDMLSLFHELMFGDKQGEHSLKVPGIIKEFTHNGIDP